MFTFKDISLFAVISSPLSYEVVKKCRNIYIVLGPNFYGEGAVKFWTCIFKFGPLQMSGKFDEFRISFEGS